MAYKDLVTEDRIRFVGKKVKYKGGIHTIIDVDYNGSLIIDLKARFTDDTAVYRFDPDIEVIL